MKARLGWSLGLTIGVIAVALLGGGLTLWAQSSAFVPIGGSYLVSSQIDVNGNAVDVLLLATFTVDGKVLT